MNETIRLDHRAAPQRRNAAGLGPGGTAFVRLLKLVLPLGASVLLVLVVFWPQINKKEAEGFRSGVSELTQEQARDAVMLAPRYEGFDEKNRPFALLADEARQVNGADSLVELTEPKGDMTLGNGGWLALQARNGLYDLEAERLDLAGDVQMFHDDGLEFSTARARVDLAGNRAEGDESVHGQGSFGVIDAEGFRVEDGGARIVFTGRARLLLNESSESPLL